MKPTTIRLPEDVLDELDREAEEHGFHTRTEYLRYLIDNRELVVSIALEERKTRVDALVEQVEALEERVETLEEESSAPERVAETDAELALADDGGESDAAAPSADAAEETEREPSGGDAALGDAAAGGPAEGDREPTRLDMPDDEEESDPLDLRDPGPEDIETRVERLEFFAPTREIRREREEAVVAAWEALVESRELTRSGFHQAVFGDHTATFTTFDGWYDRLLVPALEQLDDVERVDENTWRYVGTATGDAE